MVPLDRADEMIDSGAVGATCDAAATIVRLADCVWAGVPLSVTVTAKLDDELNVGVPDITPELERESPRGN